MDLLNAINTYHTATPAISLPHLETHLLIWFVLLTVLAEVLGTIGGFGSSVFFVPLAGFFLDFHSVLGITVVFHLLSNLSKIFFFRHSLNWKVIIYVGIPSVLFALAGSRVVDFLNDRIIHLLLGIFLLMLSLSQMLKPEWQLRPTNTQSIIAGGLSGFLAGITGTGGAIRGAILTAFRLEKGVFVATSAAIDLAVDTGRGVVYASEGYIHEHDLYLVPFLLVAAVAGTWIGKYLLNLLPQEKFRVIVLFLILMIGLVSLFDFALASNT